MKKSILKDLLILPGVEIYLYGGFLRDLLLKNEPSDIDLKVFIKNKDKRIQRKKIVTFFLKKGYTFTLSKIPHNGLLLRFDAYKLDLVIYSEKTKETILTDFFINSLHINLRDGKYFFPKKYLKSLICKKIIHSSLNSHKGQKIIRGLYLFAKLEGFTLSNLFLNFIKENKIGVQDIFYLYATTTDTLQKVELEKFIFIPYKKRQEEIKAIWNAYGITEQLLLFLDGTRKTQETFFEERLDQFHKYAEMLCE